MDALNLFDTKASAKTENLLGKKRLDSTKDTTQLGASNRIEPKDKSEKSQFSGKLRDVSENKRQENDDGNKLPSDEHRVNSDENYEKDNEKDKEQDKEKSLAIFLSQLNYGNTNNGINYTGINTGPVNSATYSETLSNQVMSGSFDKNMAKGGQQNGTFDFQKQFFDQDKLLSQMTDKKKGEGESFAIRTANLESSKLMATETSGKSLTELNIKTPVSNKKWTVDFNNHIALMAKNGGGDAKIKLNPAHLGPIEANIKIVNEVATINIAANHLQTRDAIDAGVVRLKDMLAEQGFSQVDVNVSQDELEKQSKETDSESESGSGNGSASSEGGEKGDEKEPGESQVVESSVINGVLDAFA